MIQDIERGGAAVLLTTLLALGSCSEAGHPGEGRDGGGTPASAVMGALFPDLEAFTGLSRTPRERASSGFWEHWGDGRAELSGYRLTTTRYGEPREAELALVYVTEPHDRRSWIKDDGAGEPDRVEVLKLLRSVRFLTGIYPYSILSGTFAPVDDWRGERFSPVRINLDVQEWCGSVSHRVFPGPGRARSLRLSYFASEGETLGEIEVPEGTLYEDALLIQLRELDGPFSDGGDWEGRLVPELWSFRAGRGPVAAVTARITRSDEVREGLPVTVFTLVSGDYTRRYVVEKATPRRVLAWETSAGERAELLSTERLAYWSLNRAGDEIHREALGLDPGGGAPPGEPSAPCAPALVP